MRIGYARVSTADQSLDAQTDALRAAGCERIYEERASGRKADRPELERMLDFSREGDVIVVWKLDRLGRTMQQLVNLLVDLNAHGIGFESITESFGTSTPMGRCMLNVCAAFAEMEAELTRERTMAGLEAARRQGRTGGRRPASLEKVAQAKEKIDGGMAVREACESAGISKSTYYKYRDTVY